MSSQIIAYGAVVERSLDGLAFVRIPACKGIAIPQVQKEWLDATSLDSEDGFREWVPGLKDIQEISVPCGYTADGAQQTIADEAQADSTQEAIYYRATLRPQAGQVTGDVFEFRGFPTPSFEANDLGALIGLTVVIRPTGGFTWTRGGAS